MAEVDKEALKAANQYLGPVSATPQARPLRRLPSSASSRHIRARPELNCKALSRPGVRRRSSLSSSSLPGSAPLTPSSTSAAATARTPAPPATPGTCFGSLWFCGRPACALRGVDRPHNGKKSTNSRCRLPLFLSTRARLRHRRARLRRRRLRRNRDRPGRGRPRPRKRRSRCVCPRFPPRSPIHRPHIPPHTPRSRIPPQRASAATRPASASCPATPSTRTCPRPRLLSSTSCPRGTAASRRSF